ncbi:MAG: ferritin family protein [Desulfuromonadales bacterium]|nr:ferritin family protein [Desulfuromonadales bacterium]MDT8423638.1 ferritin family protein [Desulfuromonadales bacterium]
MSGIDQFSGYEVIRAAMEVEKKGRDFYRAMVQRAGDTVAKNVFIQLADDEIQHLKTLNTLLEKYQDSSFWEQEPEFVPYLRLFNEEATFPSVDALDEALQGEHPDLAAIDLAVAAERKFANFFTRVTAIAKTAEGTKAFKWLAEEEERHAQLLLGRRSFLLRAS